MSLSKGEAVEGEGPCLHRNALRNRRGMDPGDLRTRCRSRSDPRMTIAWEFSLITSVGDWRRRPFSRHPRARSGAAAQGYGDPCRDRDETRSGAGYRERQCGRGKCP